MLSFTLALPHALRPGWPRRAAALLASMILPAAMAVAAVAEPSLLAGRVIDAQNGKPLINASISVQDGLARTLSGAGGTFNLIGSLPEKMTLVVTCMGYRPALVPVQTADIRPGTELEIALLPTVYAGEEIVVTASRYGADVHLSHSNLSGDEIRRRQSEVDLPLLLEDTPGLYAATDAGNGTGYTYLKIRGFDQRRVGVLINGIPLNDPEDHQVYWVDLPDFSSSLEDIQVQRGITNSVGGLGAMGGTVNLLTETLPAAAAGRLTLQVGSYGTAKQTLSYSSGLLDGRFSSALRLSHLESDGYRDRAGTDQWAVFWSGRYLRPRSSTQVNIFTGREVTEQAWYGIDEQTLSADRTANPETYHNAVDDFRQPHYELHHTWQLSARATLRNSAFVIHGEGYYENFLTSEAGQYSLDRFLGLDPAQQLGLVQQLHVRKDQVGWLPQLELQHQGGRLILGGDAYTFHSNHWGQVLAAEGVGPLNGGAGYKYHEFTGDKKSWSVFLNDRLEITSGLTMLLDLQYQHRDYDLMQEPVGNFTAEDRHAFSVDYDFFNPRGGLHWRVPGQLGGGVVGLYGHLGRTQLEPSLYDLYDTWQGPEILGVAPLFRNATEVRAADGTLAYLSWSDPVVQPEKAANYELGASFRSADLALTVNGYWMDIQNEIVPFGGIYLGYGVKGNADRTKHRGLEMDLTAQLSDRQTLSIVASRSWDEFDAFLSTETVDPPQDFSGNPIALFPRYLTTVRWRSDWGALDTTVRWRAVGKQHLDNSGRQERIIDAYSVLDLGVGLDLGALGWPDLAGARLQLNLRNLLDEEYETNGYYDSWAGGNFKIPAAKRNMLLGLAYDF